MNRVPADLDPPGSGPAASDPGTFDPASFDKEAAWLRRFTADGQASLRAFALRLREAMPDRVTVEQKSSLFGRSTTITGVAIELGDHRYILTLDGARIRASIALRVRGITLQTRDVEPAEWFERLAGETRHASEHAGALARSLSGFMGG